MKAVSRAVQPAALAGSSDTHLGGLFGVLKYKTIIVRIL